MLTMHKPNNWKIQAEGNTNITTLNNSKGTADRLS